MASKNSPTITLNLDFNVEKAKIQEISTLLDKNLSKGLKSGKGDSYFNNISTAVNQATREATQLYKALSKPLGSKNEAVKLGKSLETVFDGLEDKILSFQGNVSKTLNSIGNTEALRQIKALGNEISAMMDDYQQINKLNAQIKNLGNKSEITKQINQAKKDLKPLEVKKQSGALSKNEIKLQEELNRVIEEGNKKLEEKAALGERIKATLTTYKAESAGELKGQIDDKILQQNNLTDASLSLQDFNILKQTLTEVRVLLAGLSKASKNSTLEIARDADEQTAAFERAEDQARTFKAVLSSLGLSFSLDWVIGIFKRVGRYSYEYIKNLDRALTEISVVSNKSRQEALALTDTFIDLSARTGMAIDDIAQASTIFYQQGLNDKAVEQLTEWTALFAKISNETVEVAADQLTAAINGFGFAAEQVGDVVDKMSVLAAYSAADINELATAMSKGASAAAQAGLSFDQYNAYLATMIETTREAPENIGTSLKTIMARFQQVKSEGTSDDGETDVNAVETALKSVGIQLRDSQNQLRDLGDVLDELGPRWKTLDRNTQAYLGTVIAGTRQQSRFISLMQNWDRALELVEASENSAGAATRMHAKAMDGLDASLNKLTNAWQKLISSLANSNVIKTLVDVVTGLVKWLSDGNSFMKMFAIAMVILNAKTLLTNVSLLRQKKTYENLNVSLKSLKATTQSYWGSLVQLTKAHSEETLAIRKKTEELNKLTGAYNQAKAAEQGYQAGMLVDTKTGVSGVKNLQVNRNQISGQMALTGSGVSGSTKDLKGVGKSIGSLGSNIMTLVGSIQMAIGMFSLLYAVVDGLIDFFSPRSSEELRERAQNKYDKTQKTIDKQLNLIEAVETNSKVYDELSGKINKSTEEVQKLAEATEALAEAAPEAVIGYDSNGNAIINTAQARASATIAEQELAKSAKTQIGNLGSLGLADIREEAEAKAAEGPYDTIQTIGKGAVATGTTMLGLAAANVWNPAGWVLGIAAGITILGGALAIGATAAENHAISQEELNLAQEQATKIQEKYRNELLQYMSYITDANLSSRTIKGTSENQRSEMAAFVNSVWLDNREKELLTQLANKDISKKEYEEAYKNLGAEWEVALKDIGENALASGYVGLESITENIGDKTYDSVEEAIEKLIKNDMGISASDPLFKAVKDGFLSAAYNGVGGGIDQIVKELEQRQADNPDDSYAYSKAIRAVKGYTANEASFVDQVGLLDNVDVFNGVMDSHGSGIKDALKYGTSNATVYTIDALEAYKAEKEQILKDVEDITDWTTVDMEELTDEQKELVKEVQDATAAIETAWATLPYSSSKTWESLFNDYEKITERTKTAFDTMHKLTSGEGLNYDEFKNFALILDDINLDAFDAGKVNEYSAAIDRVTASLYVENGALYMNAEAVKDIASLEQMLAEAEKEEIRTTLISRRTELEASRAVIKAEIATLEYRLASAKKSADASQKKEEAELAWSNASKEINKVFDANQAKVATAMVGHFSSAFSEVATKYNQLVTGMNGKKISSDTLENFEEEWEAVTKDLNFDSYEKKLDGKSVKDLTSQLEAARKVAESYDFQISNINLQLALLDSGFRDTAEGTEGAAKALEEYNSKLERFLELLKHIEREQQHLSVAEMFEDSKTGSAAIDALDRQLKYTQHLIKDTQELYQAYEGEASKQAATIRKGFGDMVTFDKWGNYNVDMDKYNAMSDKEKEKLDEWLSVYDGLIDKRDEYYNQNLEYITDELANNQKRIDKYIDAEDQLVEAIKQREQKILDNKLEAIDKEIEAIEKAADARRKAREAEDNSKELSSMQVDLQRALMDSSGASASQILNIQKQIKEKQQEIADDSFDTMVDDMKTQLEEEKKMEKALFDERLEEMDWYWDEVDRIMSEGTDSVLETMQLYLDDYTEASEIQQTELLKGWTDTFEQALTIGRSGAIKLQSVVSGLQTGINNMVIDEDALTDEAVNTAFEKRPEIEEDKTTTSGGGGGGGNWYNYSPQSYDPTDQDTPEQEESIVIKKKWYDSTKGNQITNGLTKTGAYIAVVNKDGKIARQNIWKDSTGMKYYWKGSQGKYLPFAKDIQEGLTAVQVEGLKDTIRWLKGEIGNLMFCGPNGETYKAFKTGGLADFTGPAWLDGTASQPEAVLNAMQTKAFLSFTDDLAALRAEGGASTSSSITIDNISFNVESMSSVADGEKAFNAFVDKFKEIGAKQGISVLGTANRN